MANKYLELAARVAAGGDMKRTFRLGAVAIRDDGAIVVSVNGATKEPNDRAHAEAKVLRKAGKNSTLYVARVLKSNGEIALAKPCSQCMAKIRNAGVKKVFYTISENEYGVLYINK